MTRNVFTTAAILIVSSLAALAADEPRVFSLNPVVIKGLRERAASSKITDPALDQLRSDADRSMKLSILSVTQKKILPPSIDKHDYMSLAPYWWPNPQTTNHLPYIRRDGERNPEVSEVQDHKQFSQLMSATHTLALAYYLLREEAYAAKAAELLRAWFIAPQTRMNPNLNFAQAVRGKDDGRGAGLIETRELTKIVDAVGLLKSSRAWTSPDQKAMEAWCAAFLDWLQHSKNGKEESRARNNHGSFYDVQIVSLALFTGDTSLAKRVLQDSCEKRIRSQIESDGRQPLELARTKSLSYSAFNLKALEELASLGDRAGIDLWSCQASNGASIRKALDYLAPFASGERKWRFQQIEPVDRREIAALFAVAAVRYGNSGYKDLALQLDPQVVRNVAYPLEVPEDRKGKAGE